MSKASDPVSFSFPAQFSLSFMYAQIYFGIGIDYKLWSHTSPAYLHKHFTFLSWLSFENITSGRRRWRHGIGCRRWRYDVECRRWRYGVRCRRWSNGLGAAKCEYIVILRSVQRTWKRTFFMLRPGPGSILRPKTIMFYTPMFPSRNPFDLAPLGLRPKNFLSCLNDFSFPQHWPLGLRMGLLA